MIAESRASFEKVDNVLVLPAPNADHDELRSRAAESGDQIAPDMQKKQVVLTGLDCAANHKVWMAGDRSLNRCISGKNRIGRQRRDKDRDVPAAQFAETALNPIAHDAGRVDCRT